MYHVAILNTSLLITQFKNNNLYKIHGGTAVNKIYGLRPGRLEFDFPARSGILIVTTASRITKGYRCLFPRVLERTWPLTT